MPTNMGWNIASVFAGTKESANGCHVPNWAGFNSLIDSTSYSCFAAASRSRP